MIKSLVITLASLTIFVSSAFALSLNEARSKGMVKELPSGYILATNDSAKALEAEVNKKRKAAYASIAKKTKTDVKIVSEQAGKKLQMKYNK